MEAYIPCLIFAVILADHFLFSVLEKKLLRSSRDIYKWVRRESRLLSALAKDYVSAENSAKEINRIAGEVWDSQLGITLQLEDAQRRWLEKSAIVAREAEEEVERYEARASSGDFRRWLGLALVNLVRTFWLTRGINNAKKRIGDRLESRDVEVKSIWGSLERSIRDVASLKDKPVGVTKNRPAASGQFFSSGARMVCVLRCLVDEVRGTELSEIRFRMHSALMKDLRGLVLESEMERSWTAEAQRLVLEAEGEMYYFFSAVKARERRGYRRKLLSLGSWTARRKLKESFELADGLLSDLFEAKERYGFRFVRRESSRVSRPSTLRPGMIADVSSSIEYIRSLLDPGGASTISPQAYNEVIELSNQLEQTQKLVREMEVSSEGAHNGCTACREQLQKMASDAKASVKAFVQSGPYSRVSSALPFLSREHVKFLLESERIKQEASLVQESTRVCRVEVARDPTSLIGLEEDVTALAARLTSLDGAAENRPMIVCVVGMKGIGKTALAKEIYYHESVLSHFDSQGWFCSEMEKDSGVVRGIADFLGASEEGETEEKRRLLVLDGLLSKEAWDVLQTEVFADVKIRVKNNLKIVITTRYKDVASYVDPGSAHRLRLRSREESWEFFTQMVLAPTPGTRVEALAKKVVGRTGGLPLAILHLGCLFLGKEVTDEVLSGVLEHVTQGYNLTLWADTWINNKVDLISWTVLGKCFSYIEFFPRDFEIPSRRLVALWIAQGVVQSEGNGMTSENVAYECLSELISCGVVQIVKMKRDGTVKTCLFPGVLRDICSRFGESARSSWPRSINLDRHIAYHSGDSRSSVQVLTTNWPSVLQEERYPLSIVSFDSREGNKPGEDIGNFLRMGIANGGFLRITVLDLEGVFRPNLPSSIRKLKRLTYLGLRWTCLESLPSAIGDYFVQLQTLDMKHTYVPKLPGSVWKLRKLRHLYLNQSFRTKFLPQPSANSMKYLQTLTGAFVDHESITLIGNFDKLINLRKLKLVFQLTPSEQDVLQEWILKMNHLECLSLRSVDYRKKEPGILKLMTLRELGKLSSLYLFGELEISSTIGAMLPNSLTELTLSASGISDSSLMEELGDLPRLKFLSLLSGSYTGEIMWCSMGFHQLLALKLWNLNGLQKLAVKEGAMPNLRELEIRSCLNLSEIEEPKHFKNLKELKLANMPHQLVVGCQNDLEAALMASSLDQPVIRITNN